MNHLVVPDTLARFRLDADDAVAEEVVARARHAVPELVWDESLAASSAAWAKRCRFSHSRTGENLCAGHKDWNACISAWYNEIASYNYKQGSFSSAVRVSTFFFALFFLSLSVALP